MQLYDSTAIVRYKFSYSIEPACTVQDSVKTVLTAYY